MKEAIVAAAMAVAFSSAAFAHDGNVKILSEADIFSTEAIIETVEVCTKGDDKTTEGAIVGGLIGSQDGNAGLGALIGAIIGNEIGEETCKTETRKVGEKKIYSHTNIVIELYGQKIALSVKK